MLKRIAIVALAAAGLAGCASGGPTGKELLTGSIAPSQSRIVFYRDSSYGFAIQPSYTVNGNAVGTSQPNGFVVCNMAPGTYTVAAANIAGDQSILGGGKQTATVTLQPGRTTYVRAQPQTGLVVGYISVAEVTEGQGQKDTAGLSKIESTCT